MIKSAKTHHKPNIDTAFNIRSLANYPTISETLTANTFYRGDCFRLLSNPDAATLFSLGVRTVIDLRDITEIIRTPSPFAYMADVAYLIHPMLSKQAFEESSFSMDESTLTRMYVVWLEQSKAALRDIFRALHEGSRRGKVFFHCTLGKDRTGIVAALLLDIAGVTSEIIVEDFLLTNGSFTCIAKEADRKLLEDACGFTSNSSESHKETILKAHEKTMRCFLRHLYTEYNGAEGYLLHIGLSKEECNGIAIAMAEKKMAAAAVF